MTQELEQWLLRIGVRQAALEHGLTIIMSAMAQSARPALEAHLRTIRVHRQDVAASGGDTALFDEVARIMEVGLASPGPAVPAVRRVPN